MIRPVHHTAGQLAVIFALILSTGCTRSRPTAKPVSALRTSTQPMGRALRRVAIIVPGVFGDGPWYDALVDVAAVSSDTCSVYNWGVPKLLFFKNFSNADIHAAAEQKLSDRIDSLPSDVATIDIVGHSAGCGVVLGALARCHRRVSTVVLLAPSVSPAYPLKDAAAKAWGGIYCFYSGRDTVYLRWRCAHFGTYDNIKSPASGYCGFQTSCPGVRQIAYRDDWASLGNDGGHGGWLARDFVNSVISPLLRQCDDARR